MPWKLPGNQYGVQAGQGPLLGPVRTLGLGGAYIGVSEGVEGLAYNPAAPAARDAFSVRSIDYDGTVSVVLPGTFAGTDFENRGGDSSRRGSVYDDYLVTSAGGILQVGVWGVGASVDAQSFRVLQLGSRDVVMQSVRYDLDLARGFYRDQLVVGVGLRAASMLLAEGGQPAGSLLAMHGVAPQAGLLVRPDGQRFRLGAAIRGAVYGGIAATPRASYDARGVQHVDGFILPREVEVPGELEAGIAVQLGPRAINPGWQDPSEQLAPLVAQIERERSARAVRTGVAISSSLGSGRSGDDARQVESAIRSVEDARLEAAARQLEAARRDRARNVPRARLLVVASVLAAMPTERSIAVSSFLAQRYEPYGQRWAVTPRFGIESEPVIDRLALRVGGYVEPARFADATPRQHLTFGGDLKLAAFDLFGLARGVTWRIGFAADLAPRYTNWGLGLGVWH